tara:strand:+ start:291 stop:743 length:453 start_codon:yes stop_codon:yes gene_type:complete
MSDLSFFSNVRNKFSLDPLNLEEAKTNVLDQIPSYNAEGINNYINFLERELAEQKGLNVLLKDEDYSKNVEQITSFIENKSGDVDVQLEKLERLVPELKTLISENHKLEEEKEEYIQLSQSTASQNIASRMRRIKHLKQDIKFFLEEQGL